MVEDNVKKCPYCSGDLQRGTLKAPGRYPTYWLPAGKSDPAFFISKKIVQSTGGFVLEPVNPLFMVKENAPNMRSDYCPSCKCLLTFLD